jgi:hypothetical protein
MLTELNREVLDSPQPEQKAPEPEPTAREPVTAAEAAEVEAPPEPLVERDHADTAMLLRELSSLGFGGDSDSAAPPTPPTPRSPSAHPSAAVDPKRKRKGLFGRG